MKHKILLLVLLFVYLSCKQTNLNNYVSVDKYDSLFIELASIKDSVIILNNKIDTLKIYSDSLKSEIFIKDYKLGRIKEYCNIVGRNSTQSKYLRGWINRVLEN